MKEVTRVHIAKTSYDIEVGAKKELERYIAKLELYAKDTDILEDIEIRITELLGERGVSRGGVIAAEDVAALRAQLGEPQDFAGDEEMVVEPASEALESPRRRLYRDKENAILGGVLSGFAKYLGVSTLWPRLVFLILMVGSFGSAFMIYIVLWLAIPVARTAAEKLELEGKPVTLASIRERGVLSEQEVDSRVPQTLKKVMLFGVGLISLLVAMGAIIGTLVGVFGLFWMPDGPMTRTVLESYQWVNWLVMSLFVASGVLLGALGILLAYAAFSRRFTKRMGIAMIAIVLVGLASFIGGLAALYIGNYYEARDIENSMIDTKVDLPSDFSQVKSVVATAHSVSSDWGGYSEMTIQYVVDPGKPRYVLTALPGARPSVDVVDDQARITLKSSGLQNRAFGRVEPRLIIYGPALETVDIQQGNFQYTAAHQGRQSLVIKSLPTTTTTIYGTYESLTVNGGGEVQADSSTVYNLTADLKADSRLRAGVIRTLSVTQSDVCPAQDGWRDNKAVIAGVSSGKMIYNGTERVAQTVVSDCGTVVIGSENDMEYWEE